MISDRAGWKKLISPLTFSSETYQLSFLYFKTFCNKNVQAAPLLQKKEKKQMEFPGSI